MTDIGVYQVPALPENLSWDLTPDIDGTWANSVTLDLTKFNASQHYPNGYLMSGLVVGKITASGLYGPYLSSASDGTQTAVGILKGSIQVIQPQTGVAKTKVACAIYRAWAVVSVGALPYTSSNAAAGGYLDAAAQSALNHIHFEA